MNTIKQKDDNNSIGLLICRHRNEVITEYALRGINNPIGVSQYQWTTKLPENLSGCLPTIKQIKEKLSELERNSDRDVQDRFQQVFPSARGKQQ